MATASLHRQFVPQTRPWCTRLGARCVVGLDLGQSAALVCEGSHNRLQFFKYLTYPRAHEHTLDTP
jgi:hypothetical protein